MSQLSNTSRTGAASQLADAIAAAEPLEPNDRFRLIVRLWASLPEGHWAAPSLSELVEVERRIREYDAGGRADMPWEMLSHLITKSPISAAEPNSPAQKLYSAPRRFDLFTILLVTAAYAVLLSGMSVLQFSPAASCCVAMFITLVGLSQALFATANPRAVSVYSGMPIFFLCTTSYFLFDSRISFEEIFRFIPVALFLSPFVGGPFGYLAGVLVGGVFLVADVLRQRYSNEIDHDARADVGLSRIEAIPPIHPLDDVPSISPS